MSYDGTLFNVNLAAKLNMWIMAVLHSSDLKT